MDKILSHSRPSTKNNNQLFRNIIKRPEQTIDNDKKWNLMRKIISFIHISLDGFVVGPNGEMNWIKVDEEIFDHVGKRIKMD